MFPELDARVMFIDTILASGIVHGNKPEISALGV